MPNSDWSTACGGIYDPPTLSWVTVFNTSVDTPRYLWSAITANHIGWNQPHFLPKLDANIVVTEQKFNERLIRNSISGQFSECICRWRYVWFFTNTFLVCTNYGCNPHIGHCSFIVSYGFVLNTTQHSTRNGSKPLTSWRTTDVMARKIRRLMVEEGEEGGLYLCCYRSSIGAPQSGD
jgi:hypothetical protein